MNRSKWKGPFFDQNNFKSVHDKSRIRKNNILLASRSSKIIPSCIGYTFKIHNGKSYSEIIVTKDMLGHKFGEFVFTRAKFVFKKKKLKKKYGKKK